jgi:dihydropteroate synthase-like protein
VREIGLQVAGLLTADLIRRRVEAPVTADRIIVPGRCRGDLDALTAHYGIPVVRGPEELKDLPQYFDRAARPVDLSRRDITLIAEIVDAPQLDVPALLARAASLRADGADVIDLGCLPSTPFEHLEDAVKALKASGFRVSVDSLDPQELLRGGHAGADYLLSLTPEHLWVADEVASTPVLVAREPADEQGLYGAIEVLRKQGRAFLADTILDPIPFGFTASIARYQRLRERFDDVPILMGIGNLTELVDADTSGINAILFGIAAELRVAAILTTQVSGHARRAVREADVARRMMVAAREGKVLPKGLTDQLLTVHAKRPFPDTPQEIAEVAHAVRDPNFRIQVAADGVHIYNRDGHHMSQDVFQLWPKLGLEHDGAHAFYLGMELAHAQIAWQLGKRYAQDEPLGWGVAVDPPPKDLAAWHAPGPTLRKHRNPGTQNGTVAANDAAGTPGHAASPPRPNSAANDTGARESTDDDL